LRFHVYLLRFAWGALLFINLFSVTWSQAPHHQRPFGLKIQGLRSQMDALKVQAQLKAARDTSYCRGANIPVPKSGWECVKPGPRIEECKREYQCARIKANLSRLTETRKYLAKSRKLGAPRGDYKVEFYPEPFLPQVKDPRELTKSKFKVAQVKDKRERMAKPSEVREVQLPRRTPKVSREERTDLKSSAELIEAREDQLDFLADNETQTRPEVQREDPLDFLADDETQENSEVQEDPLDFLADDESQGSSEVQEDPLDFLADDETEQLNETQEDPLDFLSDNESEDLDSIVPDAVASESDQGSEESSAVRSSFGLEWKKISTSWVSSTDQFGDSLSQFNIAWTPEFIFTKNWSLKGQLGGHVYETLTVEGLESFFVIDTFAHLQFSFWENWQVNAGVGIQQWNTVQPQSLSGIAIGVSRRVDWSFLERIYFQEVSLVGEDDVSVSELRIGGLLSF